MNKIVRFAGSAGLALAVLCGAAAAAAAQAQDTGNEYKIGPKDLLEITLLGVPEINKLVVRVSEEGRVTLPLLGEIAVGELTKFELEKKLTGLAGEKVVLNPQVTVHILEYRSRRVSVVGAVANPGPFELLGRQTVLAAISEAGGLTRDAGEEVIVIRQLPDGDSTSIRIPIDGLFVQGDPKLNIVLEAGDVVNIPVERTAPIYVFGQVRNPGALQVKRSSVPTLTQAIAQAGGFTDRANRKKVQIRRKDAQGKELEITVNVKDILKGKKKDVPLLINDTVYVPESLL
ncbi:MAG: polysaccharide export protein [Candidatus Aminicenantes bacterium]|jgi:polysaccharide export outer membrane protein|nr:polysaccharide export protein [Candidatus Aminicenantes bacterium]